MFVDEEFIMCCLFVVMLIVFFVSVVFVGCGNKGLLVLLVWL